MTNYLYQDNAVAAMLSSDVDHYLAFDAGLGKSKVAIDLAKARGVKRLLIVCPLSVVLAWQDELKRWWPNGPPRYVLSSPGSEKALGYSDGIFIVTYGLLSKGTGPIITALKTCKPFQMCVLDEAHYLKNIRGVNRTKLVLELRPQLGRLLPMSATPAPNHAGEIFPILRIVRPDIIKRDNRIMHINEFEERFCFKKSIRVKGKFGGAGRMIEVIEGSKNLDTLKAMTSTFFIRELKSRVLKELPPMTFDLLPVDTAKALNGFHDNSDLIEAWQQTGKVTPELQSVYHRIGVNKLPAVVEYVLDWLNGNVGRQLVVWAIHHDVIDGLMHALAEFSPVKLDGRDNILRRSVARDKFLAGETRLFIGQIQAGGAGLTLLSDKTRVNDCLFAESSFSPSENYQAACRIHRIGQHDGVLARFSYAAGTFDDRVQTILARKTRDFADLFEIDPTMQQKETVT